MLQTVLSSGDVRKFVSRRLSLSDNPVDNLTWTGQQQKETTDTRKTLQYLWILVTSSTHTQTHTPAQQTIQYPWMLVVGSLDTQQIIQYPWILVVGSSICDKNVARKSACLFCSTNTSVLPAPDSHQHTSQLNHTSNKFTKNHQDIFLQFSHYLSGTF